MRIITDSTADFTREELERNDVRCVPMQVMFGAESFSAAALSSEEFWQRLLSGEIGKTSQPSPDAFLIHFNRIRFIKYRNLIFRKILLLKDNRLFLTIA